MDVNGLAKALRSFARRHRTTFVNLSSRQTQILEIAAIAGVSQHYRAVGFVTQIVNPRASGGFVVKTGTRGYPWNFSHVRCSRDAEEVEIHSNLVVSGAHDDGRYCVDVGIAEANSIPGRSGKNDWTCLNNDHLKSFAEVKKLVVYPMLLAQFLGIVHEIRPNFLRTPHPSGFGARAHLPPTLIALGHFSGNAQKIVDGFTARGFTFLVAADFDLRLSACRNDPARSPFYGT